MRTKQGRLLLSFGLSLLPLSAAVADGDGRWRDGQQGYGSYSATHLGNEPKYASPERSQAAVGHYARARAMLIEALAEFEQARSIARPDLMIDSDQWRAGIVARTEELDHLLDPQPRISGGGERGRENHYLLRREGTTAPYFGGTKPQAATNQSDQTSAAAAKVSSAQNASSTQADGARPDGTSRARMAGPLPSASGAGIERREGVPAAAKRAEIDSMIEGPSDEQKVLKKPAAGTAATAVDLKAPVEKASEEPKPEGTEKPGSTEKKGQLEDEEGDSTVARSLEDEEIRNRLKKLSQDISAEEKKRGIEGTKTSRETDTALSDETAAPSSDEPTSGE